MHDFDIHISILVYLVSILNLHHPCIWSTTVLHNKLGGGIVAMNGVTHAQAMAALVPWLNTNQTNGDKRL